MVAKRAKGSRLISVGLFGVAATISFTEYLSYRPTSELTKSDFVATSEDEENDLFENGTTDSDLSESNDSEVDVVEQVELKTSATESKRQSKSLFADSNETIVQVEAGGTLSSTLSSVGISPSDIHLVSKSLTKVFNLKNLKVGQDITIRIEKSESGAVSLSEIELKTKDLKIIKSTRQSDGQFKSFKNDIPVKKIVRTARGAASTKDLVGSLEKTGLKKSIASEAVRALNQVVNLKSEKGPINYELLYKESFDMDGNSVLQPELVYASALVNGKIVRTYKLKLGSTNEYVDQNGTILGTKTSKGPMLGKPLNRMKVTSGYGYRIHPVRGFSKRHTGIDLSAPVGTPIFAAASGTITFAGRYSGYGKYVKIKHSQSIETAYGHLKSINVKVGQYIAKGQIIGYVGLTGITTGPHLHYEVKKNGIFINPTTYIKQDPQKLTGRNLQQFNKLKRDVNLQIVGLTPSSKKKVVSSKKVS